MREKLVMRQRGVSHDRDATISVIYLILAFALDLVLFRADPGASPHFPWMISQALGLAFMVTLGLRFWFVLFLSVFANAYFIWHEGRSVSAMFLAIITAAAYSLAAWGWVKIRALPAPALARSGLLVLLAFVTTGVVARLAFTVLTNYELIDPTPAAVWAGELTLRDGVNFLTSFPFFTFLFVPFTDHLVYRGTGREKQKLELHDGLFTLLPFLALALPRPPLEHANFLYLLFFPAMLLVILYRMRGALAFTFAASLWLYQAYPFSEKHTVSPALPFLTTLLATTVGVAYWLEKTKQKQQALLQSKEEELTAARAKLIELEENRREWRSLTQTLERLVIRSTQDLRTPLTPIYMWSQMLKEDGSSQAIADASDGIKMHIERQTKMLEELRDSVRISMGHQTIRKDTFDLADVLQELAEHWHKAAEAKKLDFRYERPLKSTLIMGDREALAHALDKLFEHLLQYGRDHAVISLHATTQHRDVILHLKHSGYSSDQQHVLKLLQAGQGMDPEAFLTAANFDLALYTAKKLIDLQGGRLTAASLNPKPGMLFSLSLKKPKRDAKASVMPLAQAAPMSLPNKISMFPVSEERQTMLLVEDDPFTLHLLDSLLSAEGIHTIPCANAAEAIEAFHRDRPALVLADLGLPDINGFELIRRLKKSGRHEFIAVAFSACVTPEAEQQAYDAGFSAFLAKPLEAKVLIETMQLLQTKAKALSQIPAPGSSKSRPMDLTVH